MVYLKIRKVGCPGDWGTFQVHIFKGVQNLAYFHIKYQYKKFTNSSQRGSAPSVLNTPLFIYQSQNYNGSVKDNCSSNINNNV